MLEDDKTNSEKSEYQKQKDKIKEYAKIMEEYVKNGYIESSEEKQKSLKLDGREMALVYNELALKEAKEGKYDDAKSLFLEGIRCYKDLPILHYGLGVVLVKLYETKGSEKELKKAEKELKKAKRLIEEKKLELPRELNEINDLLSSLDPPWIDYPDILRRSIIFWLEKIIGKLAPHYYTFNNKIEPVNNLYQGNIMSNSNNNNFNKSNIANSANQVQDNARQQANQHIYNSDPQKQTLTEAAKEIQKLLEQLEQIKPTATEAEKVAYVNDETTPAFKRRVVGALQASGETAIDEFILQNKYLKVAKAAIKGWLQPHS